MANAAECAEGKSAEDDDHFDWLIIYGGIMVVVVMSVLITILVMKLIKAEKNSMRDMETQTDENAKMPDPGKAGSCHSGTSPNRDHADRREIPSVGMRACKAAKPNPGRVQRLHWRLGFLPFWACEVSSRNLCG